MLTSDLKVFIEQYAAETSVSAIIHPDDFIFQFLLNNESFETVEHAVRYYFTDGQRSASKLDELLFSNLGLTRASTSLLEFASGYGCVTRHLAKTLLVPSLVSSDIHPKANTFLSEVLNVETMQSTTDPEKFPHRRTFDVVFALSFLSHMPHRTWGNWLKTLFSLVRPNGFLIFTTHGLHSRRHFGNPLIPNDGVWFLPASEQQDLEVSEYGQTIVRTEYVVNQVLERIPDARFQLIDPAFWWGHQDLYVLKRETVNRPDTVGARTDTGYGATE